MQSAKPIPASSSWFKRIISWLSWTSLRTALLGAVARLRRRRVPVIMQMGVTECGAACLAMILSYFGRKTEVVELSESCGVGRDGLPGGLRRVGRVSYGGSGLGAERGEGHEGQAAGQRRHPKGLGAHGSPLLAVRGRGAHSRAG